MSKVQDELNATFAAAHPELVKEFHGQYVIVHGPEIVVGFTGFIDAMMEAVGRWGSNGEFMIRRVDDDPMNEELAQMLANCPCCRAEATGEPLPENIDTMEFGGFQVLSIPFAPPRLPRAARRRLEREAKRAAARRR